MRSVLITEGLPAPSTPSCRASGQQIAVLIGYHNSEAGVPL